MNRRDILRSLRATEGLSGWPSEADSLVKWLESEGVALQHKGRTLTSDEVKKAWNTSASATIEADADLEADADDAADRKQAIADSKVKARASNRVGDADNSDKGMAHVPGMTGLLVQDKAYNRRANGNLRPGEKNTVFEDAEQCRVFAAWARQSLMGGKAYDVAALDRELVRKAQVTYDNTLGGSTVPDDFSTVLTNLKELRGVARQFAQVLPMARETMTMPRRTAGSTVYVPGEGTAGTTSNISTDSWKLVATKMVVLCSVSSELLADSNIVWGDLIAEEFAYALANKEDDCYFNGTGTSTYFGFTGWIAKLLVATASLQTASGSTNAAVAATDITNMMGLVPAYVDVRGNPKFVAPKRTWYATSERLKLAQGGVTYNETAGKPTPNWLGAPNVFAQVIPVGSTGLVTMLYGDGSLGGAMGDVKGGMAIDSSEHVSFTSDLIVFRARQRWAMTIHDAGDTSTAGPVVGLKLT